MGAVRSPSFCPNDHVRSCDFHQIRRSAHDLRTMLLRHVYELTIFCFKFVISPHQTKSQRLQCPLIRTEIVRSPPATEVARYWSSTGSLRAPHTHQKANVNQAYNSPKSVNSGAPRIHNRAMRIAQAMIFLNTPSVSIVDVKSPKIFQIKRLMFLRLPDVCIIIIMPSQNPCLLYIQQFDFRVHLKIISTSYFQHSFQMIGKQHSRVDKFC